MHKTGDRHSPVWSLLRLHPLYTPNLIMKLRLWEHQTAKILAILRCIITHSNSRHVKRMLPTLESTLQLGAFRTVVWHSVTLLWHLFCDEIVKMWKICNQIASRRRTRCEHCVGVEQLSTEGTETRFAAFGVVAC